MFVEIIGDVADIARLRPEWEALLEETGGANPFIAPDWLLAWLRHFGRKARPAVAVARCGRVVSGIAPLVVTSQEGFRRLGLPGSAVAGAEDFVVLPEMRASTIAALVDALHANVAWDIWDLTRIPEDSPNFEPLFRSMADLPGRQIVCRDVIAPYLPIATGWESYWQGLSGQFRRDTQRRRRRLDGDHDAVRFVALEALECWSAVDPYLDTLFRHHNRRWMMFRQPAMRAFFRDLLSRWHATGHLRFCVLEAGGVPAALHAGVQYGGVFRYLLPAFDPTFAAYSVGRLLAIHLLESSFRGGTHEFDFGVGEDWYKQLLRPQERRLRSGALSRPTWRGAAAEAWFHRIRPRLRRQAGIRRFLRLVRL